MTSRNPTLTDLANATAAMEAARQAAADATRHRDEVMLALDAMREKDGETRTHAVNDLAATGHVTREYLRQLRLPPEQKSATRRKAATPSKRAPRKAR